MKTTKLLTFLILLFLGLSAYTQNFRYGIVGGLDITKNHTTNLSLRSDNYRVYDSMLSFNINGHIGYKSESFWGVSLEPGFMRKGGIYKNETSVINDDIKVQLDYIQMPILFDIYMTDKIFLSLGPEIAYLFGGRTKSAGITSYNIWDLYSSNFEISGLIGINYCLSKNLDIGVRYNHGLTWISKVIYYESNKTSNEYNQYLQLMIRFKI